MLEKFKSVIKRDKSQEDFDYAKITAAVSAAFVSCNEPVDLKGFPEYLSKNLQATEDGTVDIENIQNTVENFLMETNKTVAKAFILYRSEHSSMRDAESMSQFIDEYIGASNAATGSKFDPNANVTSKNVCTLKGELPKKKFIDLNRYRMFQAIKKRYSKKLAKQYIQDIENHLLYKHDESSVAGVPYTYSAKEVINVLYKGEKLLVPFDLLYSICEEPEILVDSDKEVYQKRPIELYVYNENIDSENILNNYVKVSFITKKARHRDLYRVKTAFGEDLVVTDNHPMIVNKDNIDNNIEAQYSAGYKQFKTNIKINFDGKNKIAWKELHLISEQMSFYSNFAIFNYKTLKPEFELNRKLGYIVGFFVGDGNYNNSSHNLSFTQKDKNTLVKINEDFYDIFGTAGYIYYDGEKDNCWKLNINCYPIFYLFKEYFRIQDKAWNKTLPANIYQFNEEFALGIIEGMIDSDGTIGNKQMSIRLSSRAAVLQLTDLLRHFGFSVGNTIQNIPFGYKNTSYKTNYTVWGVNTSVREGNPILENSYKMQFVEPVICGAKSSNIGETNIAKVEKIEESSFYDLNHYIYDITTDTHTFSLNNILVHNCASITLYPWLKNGMKTLGGPSDAPKNLESFSGQFTNLVFAVASQFAGAVATPEMLMYMDYFIRKEFGDDYINHLHKVVRYEAKNRTIEDVIDAKFQQIVHTINQPAAARDFQSVFWNIGYFDKYYFDSMFKTFRFPDNTAPIWETLSWLQKHFMKWFNKERTKSVLTFPVETMALLSDGNGDFKDKEYADFTAEMYAEGHSFFTYISDSADSLSSCCFEGSVKPMMYFYNNEDSLMQEAGDTFEEIYRKFADTSIQLYTHKYDFGSEQKIVEPVRLVKSSVKELIHIYTERGDFKCTKDHIFPVRVSESPIDIIRNIDAKDLTVGNMLVSDEKECVEIIKIEEETFETPVPVYCFDFIYHDSPYFVLDNGIITHNCRLRNAITDNQFSFSLGAGGVMTGSKSVMTINFNRLIQDTCKGHENETIEQKTERIHEAIADVVKRVQKYQICYNDLVYEMYRGGLLPVYNAGFIDLKKQYLTIGVNGMVEGCEYLGFEISNNDEYKNFLARCLSIIKELNKQARTQTIMFNTEFVPAEGLGVKNAKWDKRDGYFVPRDAYNSYFFRSEDDSLSLLDKIGLHSKQLLDNLDGGSANHMNLDEHLTEEQYRHILNVSSSLGASYNTFNVPNGTCNSCGHIEKYKFDICPKCGSTDVSYLTRIIGYLKKVSNFSEARQKEANKRHYHKRVETGVE